MPASGRYGQVLRRPQVAVLLGSALVARIPIGIYGIAIVLFLRAETGSYATAGIVAAAFALGSGGASPVQGRLIDHHGPRRVLPTLLVLHAAALSALCGLGAVGAPAPVLVVSALLAGVGVPPVSAVLRTLWPGLLQGHPGLLTTAFALDGVLVELVFVTGPLIVAVAVAVASPVSALILAGVLQVLGTLFFLSLPATRAARAIPVADRAGGGLTGALKSRGLRTLVLGTIPFGACFGAMEVALPAFAEHTGDRGRAGLLLAAWSLASAAGGLAYGAWQPDSRFTVRETYVRAALLLPLGYLPLAFAPSFGVMVLLLIPAGVCIAPLLTAGNQLVGDVAPAGMATEAFTWPMTSLVVGIAVGNAGAGALVELGGWTAGFSGAAGVAAVGAATVLARRASLTGPVAPA